MSDPVSQPQSNTTGPMPTTIGRYAILRKLGQGGMGAVYEAEHTKLKKRVALKVLPQEVSSDPAAVARFEREMEAVGRVDHPGIIRALDADEADGIAYLAMELVDGQDLLEVASFYEERAGKPMPISVACEIIRQASLALQAAHDAGLVHRDMKPSNLMLGRDGTVKVLDLGLALLDAKHSEGGPLTSTGQVMGTVDYMAPEQAAETHNVDARADVYSLGATLYRLISGKAPYPNDRFSSVLQKLMALANTEPTSLTELRPKCPEKLADVVAKAMAKDVAQRIATAGELASILAPACDADKLQELASLIPERPPVEPTAIEATSAMPAPTEPRMSADPTVDTDGSPEATFIAKQAREITDPGSFDATFVSPALSGDQTVASQRAGVRRKNAKSKSPIKAILVGGVALAAVALAVTFLRSDTAGTITFKVPADFPGTASLRIHSDALVVADNVKVSAAQPEVALPDVPTGRVRIRLTGGDAPAYEIDPTEFRLGNSQNQFVELTAVPPKGLLLDGQDDIVSFDPVDWSVREFTIEAFVTSHPSGGSGVPVTLSDDAGTYFFLYDGDNATNKRRTAGFFCKYRGGENTSFAESEVFQPGIRQHRALSFDGRSLHYFVDGQRVNTHELNDGVIDPIAFKKLQLGRRDGEGAKHFSGLIDDLRISSTARYLKDFEPPSQLATDNQTLAFYPLDSVEDLRVADTSGNGHDGKISGAEWIGSPKTEIAPGIRFDGDQSRVWLPNFGFDVTKPYTIEIIATPLSYPANVLGESETAFVLGKSDCGLRLQPNGQWLFGLQPIPKGKAYHAYSTARTRLQKPAHVVGTFDGKDIRLFVDGKQQGSPVAISEEPNFDPWFMFGGIWRAGNQGSIVRAFDGIVHEARISKGVVYESDFNSPGSLESRDDTVAHYRFDAGSGNTVRDLSRNSFDGKIEGANWVKADDDVPARITGLEFDGIDDWVKIDSLQFDGSHPITLEAHVTLHRQDGARGIVSGQMGAGIGLATMNDSAGIVLINNRGKARADYEPTIPLNQPVHLAGTWDGEKLQFFVDGKIVSTADAPREDFKPSPYRFALGAYPAGTDGFLDGVIHDARISRVVRYTEDFTPNDDFANDDQTLALYHIDEGTGDLLRDFSGNGHDGNIIGAEWVTSTAQLAFERPGFDDWVNQVAALPTVERVAAVRQKMIELNPRSKANFEENIRSGFVRGIKIDPATDIDLSPLRAFQKLAAVFTEWQDESLTADSTLTDLTPLRGMPLSMLYLSSTSVTDLAPLAGMPLTNLHLNVTSVSDLAPLRGMPLEELGIDNTKVTDLAPLSGMPLKKLMMLGPASTADLSVLTSLPLEEIKTNTTSKESFAHLRSIKTLKMVNGIPAKDYWKSIAASKSGLTFNKPNAHVDSGEISIDLSAPFTAELWCRPIALHTPPANQSWAHQVAVYLGGFELKVSRNKSSPDSNWQFTFDGRDVVPDVNGGYTLISSDKVVADRRMHVAAQWTGQQLALFIDGIKVKNTQVAWGGADSDAASHVRSAFSGRPQARLALGATFDKSSRPAAHFDGEIDHFRLSNGNRYTEDFQPPEELSDDETTVVLYRFGEGSGGTLRDSSGNGHDGKIVGAEWVPTNGSPPPPATAPFDEAQAKAHQKAWADHLGVPVEYTNSIGMKFVLIPPSRFAMGSAVAEVNKILEDAWRENPDWRVPIASEAPQHDVVLSNPFYLGMHEVTQEQYERIMGINPSHFSANSKGRSAVAGLDTSRFPVDQASWNDARLFCRMLAKAENVEEATDYRLPTEAEWEAACRAGTTSRFCFGDTEAALSQVAWWSTNSGQRPHSVGELKANPYGLFDMLGNQWEWVEDSWSPDYFKQFEATPAIDPVGATTSDGLKILRGGVWSDPAFRSTASARRGEADFARALWYGFRVALSVDAVKQLLPTAADQ